MTSKIKISIVKKTNPSLNPSPKYTVLDLFCGCGGLSYGLTQSGLNILAGIDHWDTSIESYNSNMNHHGLCKDLTQYTPQMFASETGITEVDVIAGGPPCQGFSIAGKRDKNDPRNSLFMEYVKYLNYYKPKVFILENVMGILSMKTANGNKAIDIITAELEINYNIQINRLYASDFNVPQNRRRVIIIGIRKDLNIPHTILTPKSNRPAVGSVLLAQKDVPAKCYLSDKAIAGIINKRQRSKEAGKGFGAQYLDVNKPSYTIPARYWKDGYDALVKYDETSIRRLTILELKRIQTLPDNYILHGSNKDQIIQIGNAVAVNFAKCLGDHIQTYLIQT
jgi:DNA-cytosine methyltransferase